MSMILIYNIALNINDFLSTVLIFIIYFSIVPKSRNKSNYISTLFICIFITIFDIALPNFPDLSSVLIVLIAPLFIKSSYKLIDKVTLWLFSLLLVAVTQGLGSVVIIGTLPFLNDPKTASQSIALFTVLSLLNYSFSLGLLSIFKSFNKKHQLESFLKDTLIKKIILIALIILNLFYLSLDNLSKYFNPDHPKYAELNLFIITVTIIFITISVTMLVYSHFGNIETKLKLQQMNERDAYINELEKSNNELRRFKHDYKNLLLSLSVSADDNKSLKSSVDELLNYKRMHLTSESSKANLYSIKDKLIKGILISKLIYASNNNIKVDFEIDTKVNIPSNYSVDITRILGILLDNAIDASHEAEIPELNFALISFDGYTEFVIKNSFKSSNAIVLNKIYTAGYSTKKNHSGLGLATVNEIVNSNNNLLLQTKIKDGYYSTILTVLEDQ
ncbi:GHKL domain-containing protein [Companilactobacillus zhachilii]|uniref:sensor histidine kinase n=1 Tax=Companilactobacillus zhachilii TaxID=2304606 RepID=UPI00192391C2|nr:GHKL domain-containing protein [Companilactobacillus zhachilii]MBL3531503.1 GHKL domain-containing protein [Companilactobacillus zhachilii]